MWCKCYIYKKERPDLVCGRFINVFYKTTTCPRRQLLIGPKSGRLIQIWLSLIQYFSGKDSCKTVTFYFPKKFLEHLHAMSIKSFFNL